LLQQSGTFAAHSQTVERVMDSNDLKRAWYNYFIQKYWFKMERV